MKKNKWSVHKRKITRSSPQMGYFFKKKQDCVVQVGTKRGVMKIDRGEKVESTQDTEQRQPGKKKKSIDVGV